MPQRVPEVDDRLDHRRSFPSLVLGLRVSAGDSANAPLPARTRSSDPPASAPRLAQWVRAAIDAVSGRILAATASMRLAYSAWQVFGWGGPAHRHLIGDLAFLPVNACVITAAVAACRAQRHDRATRGAWGLLAAAFTCYLSGCLAQIYYELVLRRPLPFPSWADPCYLVSYPLILIALLRFPTHRRSREEKTTLALDTAIVALGGLTLIWVLDLAPMAAAGGNDALTMLTSLAYPAGDLVLMFGAISLLLRDPHGCAAGPLRLLLLGFGLFLVTDIWHSNLLLTRGYQGGDPIDTGWIIAQILLVLAGVAHARRPALQVMQTSSPLAERSRAGHPPPDGLHTREPPTAAPVPHARRHRQPDRPAQSPLPARTRPDCVCHRPPVGPPDEPPHDRY